MRSSTGLADGRHERSTAMHTTRARDASTQTWTGDVSPSTRQRYGEQRFASRPRLAACTGEETVGPEHSTRRWKASHNCCMDSAAEVTKGWALFTDRGDDPQQLWVRCFGELLTLYILVLPRSIHYFVSVRDIAA
jgi:hypothetical protein